MTMREATYRRHEDAIWSQHGRGDRSERSVDLSGLGTRVRVQEIGQGPPVLFLHGGPAVGSVFAPIAARLGDFRCLVIDRPGCGLSAPVDYDQMPLDDLAVAVIAGVLDGLGLDRVDIVASSLGGAWAQWFAHRHPARVGALVQLGCPAFLPEMNDSAIVFHRLLSVPVLGALIAGSSQNHKSVASAFRKMGHAKSVEDGRWSSEFFDFGASIANDTDTWKNERRLYRSVIDFRGVKPTAPRVQDAHFRIPHPTLWYWGEDEPFAPRTAVDRILRLMPNATLDVAPGAGHLPWLDDPERATAAIARHLGREPLRTSDPTPATRPGPSP
jgi:pimeloyl-ACP methyl ester carboxylesterase